MFKTASIHRKDYYKLKAKATKSNSKKHQWLFLEHMGLVFQCFERDSHSPVSEIYEVIRSDMTLEIRDIYNFMMFPKDQNSPKVAQRAWLIHKFLTNYPDLLFKRFLFFNQNIDSSHWMICCMCNP